VGVEASGPAGQEERSPEAVRVLVEALSDPESLVRGHAAWALGRISSPSGRSALERRASVEEDPWVRSEIIPSLEGSRPTRK
jgi:epoxyqueuosine reductase